MTTRRLIPLASAALLALGLAVAGGEDQPSERELRAEAEALARTNDLANKRLELAKGDAFYLVVDPNANRLALMLKGAVLRDFPMLGLEVGQPSVAYIGRRMGSEWQGRVFEEGSLEPARPLDRIVIQAPPVTRDGSEMDLPVPATPEEKYPVPSRYHVRFAGRMSLEVRTNEADPSVGFWTRLRTGLGHWWHDARSALGGNEADLLRLRLVLAPEYAKSLYRALPPSVKLIVLPKA